MPSAQQREEALFELALECPPAGLATFLDGACQGDPQLRRRIEVLLAAHQQPDALPPTPDEVGRSAGGSDPLDDSLGWMIGRYKLLEKIGEGGCGVVYIAGQTEPVHRRVALKLIKLGMDTREVIARFEAERQALALMDHPNIAQVFDAGAADNGRPFFVMELVRGIKITDHCDRHQLTTAERLTLFIQVCQAVQHAHQKGIIHRDLKPSNVLVALHDGVPVPKVIDFGIAKAVSQQPLADKTIYTAFDQFIGTPAYMSPEQAETSGLDVDTRSDIYSLGVLLYELLTGRTPFDATTLMVAGLDGMRKIIREQEPERPSTRLRRLAAADLTTIARDRQSEAPRLLHTVRGDLDWIVMKCLEKNRTRRYETANALAMDLQRHLDHEPVLARPPSPAYRFQKMVRRNKAAFFAVTSVMLALLLGLAISVWQAVRAVQSERLAHQQRQRADLHATAEKLQRETAEAEARKAKDILAFMQKMFTNTGNAYADKVTVLQMLNWGSSDVREKFKNQPEVSAAVQHSIGFCYSKIGHWDTAAGFLQDSLKLRAETIGYVNPDTLDTAGELVFVMLSLGRSAEARDLCVKIIGSARAGLNQPALDPASRTRFRQLELWASRHLCMIYLEDGKPALARPLAEEVVAASVNLELLAEENGYAWSELGTVELEEGHPDVALKAFENEIQYYNEASIVQRAWNAGMRGAAHLALGDVRRAEELMSNSLPVLEHRFTDTHFRVQRAYRDMIALYLKTGREPQADAIRIKSARGLNEVARRLATRNDPKLRNGAKAVELAEAAVRNTRRNNPAFLDTLAAAYAETGQFDKSVLTEREAIALLPSDAERKDYRVRLALYESNKPYHAAP
jgi:serine/threonine protein kinase